MNIIQLKSSVLAELLTFEVPHNNIRY